MKKLKLLTAISLITTATVLSAQASAPPSEPTDRSFSLLPDHGHEHRDHKPISSDSVRRDSQSRTIKGESTKDPSVSSQQFDQFFDIQVRPAAALCEIDQLSSLQGIDLINGLKSYSDDHDCLGKFYDSMDDDFAKAFYSEERLIQVADELARLAPSYTGNNNQDLLQLVYFLRGGTYTRFGIDGVPATTPAIERAIDNALQAMFANPSTLGTATDMNGRITRDLVILIRSTKRLHAYIPTLIDIYNHADQYLGNYYLENILLNAQVSIFDGQLEDAEAYGQVLVNDPQLINTMYQFYQSHQNLIGENGEYLLENTVGELARFSLRDDLKPLVKDKIQSILAAHPLSGEGAGLYLRIAEILAGDDTCSEYGLCGFTESLPSQVFQYEDSCSDTIKILAQHMFENQKQWVCGELIEQEAFFHRKLETGYRPVAQDNNQNLEIVLFDSHSEYAKYGGLLYNVSTNNGGIYLEGDPARTDNQARFLAHEATWERPNFQVWNLRHEYVHYLDGRFNLFGDFGRGYAHQTTWWAEGLGEYIANQNENDEAIRVARTQAVPLSEIFKNNYDDHGTERIYRWGYLAVRFMFENHRNELHYMLSLLRENKYEEYVEWLNTTVGTRYDREWNDWLLTVQSEPNGLAQFGPGDNEATTSTSTPTEGSGTSTNNNNGGGETNNGGGETSSGGTETTNTGTETTNTGTETNNNGGGVVVNSPEANPQVAKLTSGIAKQGVTRDHSYFWIYVPAGTKQLVFETEGGTTGSDIDLYALEGRSGWPTPTKYTHSARTEGSSERLVINQPQTGVYYHLLVHSRDGSDFSDLRLKATVSDTVQNQPNNNGGTATTCSIGTERITHDERELIPCQTKANIETTGIKYFYVYIPYGTTQLQLTMDAGSSDANLYTGVGFWPNSSTYDQGTAGQGGIKQLTINNPPQNNYVHVALEVKTPVRGAKITAVLQGQAN